MPEPVQTADVGDRTAAWGRTDFIALASGAVQMARVQLDKSEELLLSVDVLQPSTITPVDGPTPYLWCTLTYGNGAVSVSRSILCVDRFDVPIVASYVEAEMYIGDQNGVPLAGQAGTAGYTYGDAQVSLQIARGNRSLPYVNSRWKFAELRGAGGYPYYQFSTAPVQVLALKGHLGNQAATATQMFLQAFDQTAQPGNGTVPLIEVPLGLLPSDAPPLERYLNPRGFGKAGWLALSTTWGSLTLAASTELAWAEVELMQL